MKALSAGWVVSTVVLRRLVWIRVRELVIGATTYAFGHLTPDVRLFAQSLGSLALRPVFGALQSLAFPLRTRALTFVRAYLSFVCHPLAVVCDSVPLVSDPVSLVREPLASYEVILASRGSLLALIKLGRPTIELLCPPIELTRLGGTMLSPHNSSVRWWARGARSQLLAVPARAGSRRALVRLWPARDARPRAAVGPFAPPAARSVTWRAGLLSITLFASNSRSSAPLTFICDPFALVGQRFAAMATLVRASR
jgi:hypothetical protein